MLLFTLTLTLTYLLARLGRFNIGLLWVAGIVVNSLAFGLYTITRQLVLTDALLAGLILGLVFTSLSIVLGLFFRQLNVSVGSTNGNRLVPQGRKA